MTDSTPEITDGSLLAVFAADGSESAFAELVRRHGSMVHGVCLRVLRDHHEAQDVAQAVFLTLARKAKEMGRVASLGGWLHVIAWRLAVKARLSLRQRQAREEAAMQERECLDTGTTDAAPFQAALDVALGQLPDRYRLPLVLFHLEDRTLEQTAHALGLKASAASARLVRGREMLRKKLVRRGVTVGSVGALTALLSAEAGAAVLPATFVSATAQAASLAATGQLAAGVGAGIVSANVAALTKGAANMLILAQIKTVAILAAACVVTVGSGVMVAKEVMAQSATVQGKEASATVATPAAAVKVEPAAVATPAAATGEKTVGVSSKDKTGLPPKEQKKYLLSELDKAIEMAPEQQAGVSDENKYDHLVCIEVPGAGAFSILNNKAALEKFRDVVSPPPRLPAVSKRESYNWTEPEARKLIEPFVSVDVERKSLTSSHYSAEAEELVGTDGRRLAVLLIAKGVAKNAQPGWGMQIDTNINYPNYSRVVPGYEAGNMPKIDPDCLHLKGIETEPLIQKLRLASCLDNTRVRLYVTPEGSIEVAANNPEIGDYSSRTGVDMALGTYNPNYLLDALNFMRKTGNEKMALTALNERTPMIIRGQNEYVVQMPMIFDAADEVGALKPAFEKLAVSTRPTAPR